MTYEEFVKKGTNFYMDMVRLIDIKLINHMELTSEEKEINGYILEFQEQTKINELRDKFQKCLELEE
tara:strand:- start:41 stop:241 length:201 start_codon:yes stop_codon:yes gene_type:complete